LEDDVTDVEQCEKIVVLVASELEVVTHACNLCIAYVRPVEERYQVGESDQRNQIPVDLAHNTLLHCTIDTQSVVIRLHGLSCLVRSFDIFLVVHSIH